MAKIHKVSFYLVDTNDTIDTSDISLEVESLLENRLDAMVDFIKVKSSKEFEWEDELPINFTDCEELEFEKYFKGEDNGKRKVI